MKNEKLKAAVETAVEDTKKAVEEISKAAEPTVEKAKAAAKSAAKKAEPVVKAAVASAKTAGKTAVDTAKTTGKKVANAFVAEVYVQQGGMQYDCSNVVERCKADYRANNKGVVHSCKIYIKPEDGKAYYVINDISSAIEL